MNQPGSSDSDGGVVSPAPGSGIFDGLTGRSGQPIFADANLLSMLITVFPNFCSSASGKEPEDSADAMAFFLSKVYNKYGTTPGSPFYDIVRRTEFFLTTDRPYVLRGGLPGQLLLLAGVAISVVLAIVFLLISLLNVSGRNVTVTCALCGMILLFLPIYFCSSMSRNRGFKKNLANSYWPFASQEDFDAAKEEYQKTTYLLERKENGWIL